jgi:hypothetical protein
VQRAIAGPFTIRETTRADVDAWSASSAAGMGLGGGTCVEELAATALRCRHVPARAIGADGGPAGDDVLFRFDPAGKLVGFDVMREAASAAVVAPLAEALVASLERSAGPRSATHGETSAAYFDAPGIRMTSIEFRFSDYAADVSVSRLSERGPLVVREQYRAVEADALAPPR